MSLGCEPVAEDMHKPESLMNLKCGLDFEVRCALPCKPSSCTALSRAVLPVVLVLMCSDLMNWNLLLRLIYEDYWCPPCILGEGLCFYWFILDWLFFFFPTQIFSKPTNVSKFGSAGFQQQLSNRSDGTSSVKPRVCHNSSFPVILSATYATPAPTASATTLPAGREGQRRQCVKHMHRVMRWMGCANRACRPCQAVSFSRSLITTEMVISEIMKCARHWYSVVCSSSIAREQWEQSNYFKGNY